MVTDAAFTQLLALPHERADVEFKFGGSLKDVQLKIKVVRAMLGMANHRDGGWVIIGVSDDAGVLTPSGIQDGDLSSWTHDALADAVGPYADPAVLFDLEQHNYKDKLCVVIHVHEFQDVPVLCKRAYQDGLRKGACYVRPRHKAETSEVALQADMRDLIELATEKRLRQFVGQAHAAGISLVLSAPPAFEHYQANSGSLLASTKPPIPEIQTRGYWQLEAMPQMYVADRIPYEDLHALARQMSVSRGGWSLPQTSGPQGHHRGQDWIGRTVHFDLIREAWRLYQSSHFLLLSGFREDWRDASKFIPAPPGWSHGSVLSVEEVVGTISDLFECTARLASARRLQGISGWRIVIRLVGLAGRVLQAPPNRVPFLEPHAAPDIPEYVDPSQDFSTEDLLGRPDELARKACARLFARFAWNPAPGQLAELQTSFRRG